LTDFICAYLQWDDLSID